jgi:predicted methyltransferase
MADEIVSTTALERAVAGKHRTPEFVARDKYRHPVETLSFFELEPDHSVVEIWPGGKGWYTEMLAPLLREEGKLYAAHFPEDSPVAYFTRSLAEFRAKLATNPGVYDRVIISSMGVDGSGEIAPDNSVDRVLTFRNVHNWMRKDGEQEVMRAMFRALKPGGLLGVVEHRAKPGTSKEMMVESGYVTEDYVIEIAQKAGFHLVDRSEVNANPKDTRDHPKGVWTLPPTLRLGETDRDRYLVIGESDRMTLKFQKPKAGQ